MNAAAPAVELWSFSAAKAVVTGATLPKARTAVVLAAMKRRNILWFFMGPPRVRGCFSTVWNVKLTMY
jgi:hypothetical protein